MTKKPLIAIAVAAGCALPAGAYLAADATAQSANPRVSDLDVDLVRGNVLSIKVDATNARVVRLTYRGTTKRARVTDVDEDDGTREFTARFRPRAGDARDNRRVRVRVVARNGNQVTRRTLSDRVDDDRFDD